MNHDHWTDRVSTRTLQRQTEPHHASSPRDEPVIWRAAEDEIPGLDDWLRDHWPICRGPKANEGLAVLAEQRAAAPRATAFIEPPRIKAAEEKSR